MQINYQDADGNSHNLTGSNLYELINSIPDAEQRQYAQSNMLPSASPYGLINLMEDAYSWQSVTANLGLAEDCCGGGCCGVEEDNTAA